MKISTLPPTLENICLVSKGRFLSNITILSNNSGALEIAQSNLVRIAKFNDVDFQSYINDQFPIYKHRILAASEIPSKNIFFNDFVNRNKGFEENAFQILSEILSAEQIIYFDISFHKGELAIYSSRNTEGQKVKLFKSEPEIKVSKLKWNINNYLFDPYIQSDKPNDLAWQICEELIEHLESDLKDSVVIIGGEYFWANNPGFLIHNVIKKIDTDNLRFIIDRYGLYEALLGEGGLQSHLKYLSKSEFGLDSVYQVSTEKQVPVYAQSGEHLHFLFDDRLNVIDVKKGETIKDVEFAHGNGKLILAYVKADKSRIAKAQALKAKKNMSYQSFAPWIQAKKVLQREDLQVYMDTNSQTIEYYPATRQGIKVFDYIHARNSNKIKLMVIDGERVEKGMLLCKFTEYGSLVEKRILAGMTGYVDLSDFNSGYIFLQDQNPKLTKHKFSSSIKMRPYEIIGANTSGILEKDIKYISKLTRDNYHKFIQNGFRAILCNSIENELYFDIKEFHTEKLITIVIFDGIDVDFEGDFLLNHYEDYLLDINQEIITIGLKIHAVNFYQDKSPRSSNLSNPTSKYTYRKGHKIRIIDAQNWGDYATIVGMSPSTLRLRHGKSVNEIDILNLI